MEKKKMYVQADEICADWGVSKSQAYKMIQEMNRKMLRGNPNLIVIAGKANRRFYEQCCGIGEKAQ